MVSQWTFLQKELKIGQKLSDEKIFQVFTIAILGKKAPTAGGHVFRPINLAGRNLIEGHPRNISTKLFENRPDTFGGEDFFEFTL